MPRTYQDELDTKELRRIRHDDKMDAIMRRREDDAETMIGELCREGRKVLYVYPVGGKYREGNRSDLIAFLIRNNYA